MKRTILQPGVNDLATLYPTLLLKWSPNNSRKPEDYTPGSAQTIQWNCQNGHEWTASIREEIKRHVFCTQCATTQPTNSRVPLSNLETTYSAENPKPFSENLPKTRPLLWSCTTCGSQYSQTLGNQLKGIACPYCSGKVIKPGVNDIATLFPELQQYWDTTANSKPISSYGKSNQTTVTWHCPTCKGTWKTSVVVQAKKNPENYCPYCSHAKLLPGFNDLTTTHPHIAAQ